MKVNFFLLLTLLACSPVKAQEKVTWAQLADVSFTSKYFASVDDYFLAPTFGKNIVKYENKLISITGYFLNLDPSGSIYLLSKNPMASCFFCGGAGPESVLEIKFSNKANFKTDQVITVTGILRLNSDDINHCNYIIEKATAVLANR